MSEAYLALILSGNVTNASQRRWEGYNLSSEIYSISGIWSPGGILPVLQEFGILMPFLSTQLKIAIINFDLGSILLPVSYIKVICDIDEGIFSKSA